MCNLNQETGKQKKDEVRKTCTDRETMVWQEGQERLKSEREREREREGESVTAPPSG